MNLLDAATTIATTSDIETLFAIYSQSRAYANGKKIHDQIERQVDEIAVLNGYDKGEFKSFRELVERYDNDNSPLWEFVMSDDLLVTDMEHPLPYSFEEFLNLFRKVYNLRGLVVIQRTFVRGEPFDGFTQYRLLKTKNGLRFITKGREDEAIEGGYNEEFANKLPKKFLRQVFGEDRGFSRLRFANDFYRMVDFFIASHHEGESIEVYNLLTDDGLLEPLDIDEGTDVGIYEVKTFWCTVFDYLPLENEAMVLTLSYLITEYASWGPGEADERPSSEREEHAVYTRDSMKMFDPIPYYDLPRGRRYSAYLLLALSYPNELPEGLHSYVLPLREDFRYVCYETDEELFLASYQDLDDDDVDTLLTGGFTIAEEEFFHEIFFYTLYRISEP